MKNVTLLSISRGTPKTTIELLFDVDGQHHQCTMSQLPGQTLLKFDEHFDRLFGLSDFIRPIGNLVGSFIQGQTPSLPLKIEPHSLQKQTA